MKPAEEQLEILKQNAVEIIDEKELLKKLKNSVEKKQPLRVKMGFDPTAPDLHLGHSIGLRKLRQFQELGHQVFFIVGDFTARIGDPSGKSKTRPPLTEEEVKKNAETYRAQCFKILDAKKTTLVYNSEWCDKLSSTDMIRLAAQMNVARMLEREDFKKRYTEGKSISVHEFLYPLLQGYDSVAIRADIELGGQDQRFNLLVGRDLQKDREMEPQVLLFMPLLEGLDGVEKMSKSLGNAVGITESAREMFGKLMSIPDSLMEKYFDYLTELEASELKSLLEGHPRDAKIRLAKEIVTQYHSAEAANEEEQNFIKQFSEKKAPTDNPEITLPGKEPLFKELAAVGAFPSNAEARRAFSSGSVSVIQGEDKQVLGLESSATELPSNCILKVGKRKFFNFKGVA